MRESGLIRSGAIKNVVVISAEELKDAALHLMAQRPAFYGKHTASVEFVFDPSGPVPSRRIRIEVVLFDTEVGARRYLESKGTVLQEDEAPAPVAAGDVADATNGLEGVTSGNNDK